MERIWSAAALVAGRRDLAPYRVAGTPLAADARKTGDGKRNAFLKLLAGVIGVRYDELAVDYPNQRLALGSKDPTLEAIEWLTPIGRGSRAVIVGARHAGKTETLRRLLDAVHGCDDLAVSVVLAGALGDELIWVLLQILDPQTRALDRSPIGILLRCAADARGPEVGVADD